MLDVFNIPDGNILNQVFYTNGTTNSWQIWNKPKNCKFVSILAIGGGGGAGGGRGSGIDSAGGGGGGGSASITKGYYLASLLPDTLYIQVGDGGNGGAGGSGANGSNGGVGGVSYISILPSVANQNLLLNASGGNGGVGGVNSGPGTPGGGGAVFSKSTFRPLSYLGITTSQAGVSGGAGSSIGSTPTNLTISYILTGGGGGGGTTAGATPSVGASITGSGFVPTINGGASTGGVGDSGFRPSFISMDSLSRYPLFSTGGAGGGGRGTNGTAGAGGNGAYGSGGGGGGGAYNGTGGKGGDGGDGIIVVISF